MTTLSELLALPDLGLRLVQAGPDDPELSWVSITELLDLGAYLDGGEVILTTGLALGFDDERWHDFVAGLGRARIAAIGFGVGINHDRIPPPLVRAASAYRVALFEIPLPTPFIAVSKAAAALLRADELRAARAALSAGQRILDSARGEREPAEILASIAQATGKQLGLTGTDGSLLASTGGFGRSRDAETERIALDPEGALHLVVAGDAPLTPEGRSVIAAGAMVLGLGLRGDRADEARERERWERLADGILSGRLAPRSLEILAPGLAPPQRVRALALQGAAEDVADWRRRPRTGLDRLVSPEQDRPGEASALRLAWQLCPDAEDALARALEAAAAHGLDAVVGRSARIEDAALSRRSARLRLRSLSPTAPLYASPREPSVVWADRDAPLLEALLAGVGGGGAGEGSGSGEPGGEALSASVLGPLSRWSEAREAAIDADGGSSGDGGADPSPSASEREALRATLRAVFLSDGQRGPAASALGIHRNTLRDRLVRIERLTGRSLADADDRAELWFALRLEDLAG
ncbi:helix-turn-helix domain-containing protein [Leucobacter ruminantium]|uniref:PucR family transcriptional regulator n=1 Tax=Leucobacter ruminantium TaxID=1289170 RepID=A0A939M0B8_9MICO|nr:PucR family transcriptional regulator [Leucobacter ruminantium]